ncbi:MAG: glutamate ligase domain-containing protein, partial [Pyrinomonadaceae bacterium]
DVIIRQCESVGVQPRLIESPDRSFGGQSKYGEQFQTGRCEATADGRCTLAFNSGTATSETVTVALRGRHQRINALTAITLAEVLRGHGFQIDDEAIVRGVETANHPGRLELWPGSPRFLFDGAHNPAAALALREYLDEFVKEPIAMIFGAMREKELEEMAAALFSRADIVILTGLDNPRAASVDALVAAAPENFDRERILRASSLAEAIQLARRVTPANGLVCVTGSLYLVGAAQQVLKQ